MIVERRILRAMALAAVLPLAGCDSFGLGGTAPTAPAARALDYRHDDLSALVFAVDLPSDLQPLPKASMARFDVTTPDKGARHVKVPLVLVDGDAVDAALPAPAPGRTYYLLGFSDRDRGSIADVQHWLGLLPPETAPVILFDVSPKFCETAAIDPVATHFSVVPALAGAGPLAPIIASEPVASVIGGGQVPPCGSV